MLEKSYFEEKKEKSNFQFIKLKMGYGGGSYGSGGGGYGGGGGGGRSYGRSFYKTFCIQNELSVVVLFERNRS